jgi:subtilase family serine protease
MNPFRDSRNSAFKRQSKSEPTVHSFLKPVAFLLTFGVALSAFPQTKALNRITQAIDEGETVVLTETAQPRLQAAVDQGRMDGGYQLQASVAFKRTAAQGAALEKLLAEQQDPSSSNYHKWLTPEQYADRFGLSTSDIATVTSWLQEQGFTVTRVARSRTQIWFGGPVSKIETVFRTEMHHYLLKGESHFANGAPLAVPAALSNVVLGFRNLDDFRPRARAIVHRVPGSSIKSNFTSNISGAHFLVPDDFATIYDVKPLYTAGFDGTGVTLVVVGQTALVSSNTSPAVDIDAFRTAAGLPARTATNFKQTQVPGSGTPVVACNVSSCDLTESSLDLEWAQGVAKGVTENFVFVGNSPNFTVFDSLQYAIDQNLAPVISISYGNCEATLGAANVRIFQGWTQQANAQGQTITAASGDFGPADCDTSPALPAQGGLAVDIPGALPYVTSVGGTEFTGDAFATVTGTPPNTCASATTYWSASCSPTSGGSALQYIPEAAWNDTTAAAQLDGTGGGASIFFSKPSWQTGPGVPADGQRDVPDVAIDGSNGHDPYIFCVTDPTSTIGPCVNGFRDASSNLSLAGGTSFGAPTFAGIVAILNQKTNSKQGNVNPTLYSIAATNTTAFHDITSGNNMVPCGAGTPDCPTTGTLQYGFSAGLGYDQVTGLGTPDVNNLLNAWSTGNPTAKDFSVFGDTVGIAAPGGSGTSTITVDARNGYSGTVSFTCTAPTAALIGCSVGGPVTLGGATTSGSVTLSITTKATAALDPGNAPLWLGSSGALMAGVLVFGIPARRRRWGVALTLLTLALIASAVGCGGSSSSGTKNPGTPVGVYTIGVTASDGTTSHTTNVAVAVQ